MTLWPWLDSTEEDEPEELRLPPGESARILAVSRRAVDDHLVQRATIVRVESNGRGWVAIVARWSWMDERLEDYPVTLEARRDE